jgi:endonuclease YncB( thermonuclease family)
MFKLDAKLGAALIALAIFIPAGALAAAMSAGAATPAPTEAGTPRLVYWSDGDSGRLPDGRKFRLHNVDAPETGSLNQRGGAKCEAERALGYTAKASAVGVTRGKWVRVAQEYGKDRYGRIVVDLEVEGMDVATQLMAKGTHQAWLYDDHKPKPDWCSPPAQPAKTLSSVDGINGG